MHGSVRVVAERVGGAGREVVVVDDHRLVAHGLAAALRPHFPGVHVVVPRDANELVVHLSATAEPPVVLLDLHLAGRLHGLALVGPLRRAGARVLVLAEWETEAELLAAVEAGALGWVHKSARFEDLLLALTRAAAGLPVLDLDALRQRLATGQDARRAARARAEALSTLTPREADVLGLLTQGLAAQEIADVAVVSLATVRSQIRAVLRKLGVRSQLAAVAIAHDAGCRPRVDAAVALPA